MSGRNQYEDHARSMGHIVSILARSNERAQNNGANSIAAFRWFQSSPALMSGRNTAIACYAIYYMWFQSSPALMSGRNETVAIYAPPYPVSILARSDERAQSLEWRAPKPRAKFQYSPALMSGRNTATRVPAGISTGFNPRPV